MKTSRILRSAPAALSILVASALAACASAPPRNASLEEARAAYQRASTDPTVARVATKELQAAQTALARADGALSKGDPKEEVDHLAYLAGQRTAVAMQAGKIADADKSIADTQTQRAGIVIDARTREAEAQRRLSDERLAAAQTAQAQAQAAQTQADASRGRAASLESQLADLKAKETNRGMVLTLGDVLFETGKANLTAAAARTVDQLASFLAKNPARHVLIEGYTDSTGSDSANLELSQRRADAVRAALAQRAIGADRVDTRGLGEAYAVATNDTSTGRQLNRRVEVVFSDADGGFKMRRN